MRKQILLFVIAILLITGFISLSLFYFDIKEEYTPKIQTQIIDNGGEDGMRLFIFQTKNVGDREAELEFLTPLEYNMSIQSLEGQVLNNIDRKLVKHLDLRDLDKRSNRTLFLQPEEEIQYRILINETDLHKGKYEITLSSATGYGGVKSIEFNVE